MSGYIALDLSKSATGWAVWQRGWERPQFGHWQLGSEITPEGQVCTKLHQELMDLRDVICRFDRIFIEQPINPGQLQGYTNITTIRLAIGIALHAHSFAYATECQIAEINVDSWRPDFIGRIANSAAKGKARALRKAGRRTASATADLKRLTMARCRQLGLNPRTNDEADAIGILTYALESRGIAAPWRNGEALQPLLDVAL